MIPKIIHYCWFGGSTLPKVAEKCIESWKKYCPDYEIKEWNESNFDLNCCDFAKEAYAAEKWAFVSDYARLRIVYDEGGIYLDTDVELIKSLDDLLDNRCYMGEETTGFVATGLGFGAEKNSKIVGELLEEYAEKHFRFNDGTYDLTPCVEKNTKPLKKYGYYFSGKKIWKNENVTIFPPEYFCPLNYDTGEKNITKNTYSIHLYNASWHTWIEDMVIAIERGNFKKNSLKYKIRRGVSFPFRVLSKLSHKGLKGSLTFVINKLQKKYN